MKELTDEEIRLLSEKVASGKASEGEMLQFTEQFNILLEELKDEIKK